VPRLKLCEPWDFKKMKRVGGRMRARNCKERGKKGFGINGEPFGWGGKKGKNSKKLAG